MAVNNYSITDSSRYVTALDGTGSPLSYLFVNLVPESLNMPHILPRAKSIIARQNAGVQALYSAASHGVKEPAIMTFQYWEADLNNVADNNAVRVTQQNIQNLDSFTSQVSTNPLADVQHKMLDWRESIVNGGGTTQTFTAAGYVTKQDRVMVNGRIARSVEVTLVEDSVQA